MLLISSQILFKSRPYPASRGREIAHYPHSSFTNRCTYIKTLIKIYIKIRWLLHVSVYDHHQGACN